MNQTRKGFVISAVLYPLLVLFLALIMGLLAMTDTRKRILDKMKLEISDSIFDEATCSCDTILNKLNYLIKNGVGGSGGGGSYTYNVLGLNVKKYETPVELPNIGNGIGDVAVITTSITESEEYKSFSYYVSNKVPKEAKEGQVWVVQDIKSEYKIESDYSSIGINYAMEYYKGEWVLRKTYVYTEEGWTPLYYVPVSNGEVDLTSSDINGKVKWEYGYTGEYQTFTAPYSGYYKVELWGAQGGNYSTSITGGLGAYTSGEIYLDVGEELYLYVGSQGSGLKGGWNGGGNVSSTTTEGNGVGGGGATDVRLVPTSTKETWNEFESLKSRIMVAAGGGGAAYYNNTAISPGGHGGAFEGYNGRVTTATTSSWNINYGTGAGQSSGGYTFKNYNGGLGGFGSGGSSGQGAGGGGGYYGGGSGYERAGGSGGGGSSYISGHFGVSSIEEISLSGNIIHNGSSYHNSGYYFINSVMIDGNGYSLRYNEKISMKQPTLVENSTQTGNTGNGQAKITLLSIKLLERKKLEEEFKKTEMLWSYYYSGLNNTTGRYQVFNVKKNGEYKVELWGAQGGNYNSSAIGGRGAYTSGTIYLETGEKLYIYVGSNINGTTGGWNGGGTVASSTTEGNGAGGGGATDIRTKHTSSLNTWNEEESLKSRIMVAAGGGGGSYYSGTSIALGGAAGGLIGYNGTISSATNSAWTKNYGTGGTQLKGGYNYANSSLYNGMFGLGSSSSTGGSGGSGWYGGGGGLERAGGSGGGGSSYISGHAGCIAVDSNGNSVVNTYSELSDSISFTGLQFFNTSMIDGKGYQWTIQKNSLVLMPTHDGTTTMTGNTGDGYAKITYLG